MKKRCSLWRDGTEKRKGLRSDNPFVIKAVILSVRDDDVVGQAYVHGLGGFSYKLRKAAVGRSEERRGGKEC